MCQLCHLHFPDLIDSNENLLIFQGNDQKVNYIWLYDFNGKFINCTPTPYSEEKKFLGAEFPYPVIDRHGNIYVSPPIKCTQDEDKFRLDVESLFILNYSKQANNNINKSNNNEDEKKLCLLNSTFPLEMIPSKGGHSRHMIIHYSNCNQNRNSLKNSGLLIIDKGREIHCYNLRTRVLHLAYPTSQTI